MVGGDYGTPRGGVNFEGGGGNRVNTPPPPNLQPADILQHLTTLLSFDFFLKSTYLLSPYRDYFKDTKLFILFLQKWLYDGNVVIHLHSL